MTFWLIVIGIGGLVLVLVDAMPSARRGHGSLPAKRKKQVAEAKEENLSFADYIHAIVDKDSAVFFSQERDKYRIEEGNRELNKKAVQVEVDKNLNDLDKAKNAFDKSIIEDTKRIHSKEIEVDKKIALHEVDKAAEEVKRQQFILYLDKKFWEIAQAEKELAMAEYFFKKYRTLEIKEIQLIHKENQLELQRDRDYLENLWDKAEIKEQRVQLREDALNLLTREGVLKVRESEYRFLELKALQYLGYASMDDYYERLRTLDNLSRQYGYNSITNFGANMLEYGELRDLRNYKSKYLDLKAALEAAKEDSEQKKLT